MCASIWSFESEKEREKPGRIMFRIFRNLDKEEQCVGLRVLEKKSERLSSVQVLKK